MPAAEDRQSRKVRRDGTLLTVCFYGRHTQVPQGRHVRIDDFHIPSLRGGVCDVNVFYQHFVPDETIDVCIHITT
ncbi:MAG: hypothetical protein LBD59_01140 [Prevotellaceae bacterium]|nr:hypothetical protein [Prevotellaceae bacterium]